MPKRILIIEDEPGIRLSLRDEFEAEGFDVAQTDDGVSGLEAARTGRPDLILLDVRLPGLDGYDVCRILRREGNRVPIIMLTVRSREADKVLGLDLGADDYVTKPFSLKELRARVQAALRRSERRSPGPDEASIGPIRLDFLAYEAYKRGKKIPVTPLELDILRLLASQRGRVFSRDEILDAVWGKENVCITARTVDSHIANIRKKLEARPERPKYLLSVRSIGYKLAIPGRRDAP
jgi:two-component system alkaline phosphatase synthesis response regulator PhoP